MAPGEAAAGAAAAGAADATAANRTARPQAAPLSRRRAAGGDGLMVDAPGLEAVVGYGRNPGPSLGLGAAVIPVGHGRIVFLAIPGLARAFTENDSHGFNPLAAQRLIYNAIGGGK